MPVGFDVTNQKASPALYASSFATRPAPAFVGRLFVDTDTPSTGIYRDTGTVWLSISGGSSETQSLNDVCVIGNTTTTLGILINGQSTVGTHDSSSSSIPPEADFALTIGEDYPATGFSIYTTHKNHFAGVLRNEGTVVFDTLGGTGSRIVVASADGTLTASAALSSYVTGSGTTNYVPKFTSASAIGNSQIFDNGTNVGIGTAAPTSILHIAKDGTQDGSATFAQLRISGTSDLTKMLNLGYDSGSEFGFLQVADIGTVFQNMQYSAVNHIFKSSTTEICRVTASGLIINSTTDAGYKLDVNGTANFSGALTGTSATFSSTLQVAGEITTGSVSRSFLRQTAGGDAELGCKTGGVTSVWSEGAAKLSFANGGGAAFTSSVSVGNFTTVQKNALTAAAGMIVYDTTLAKLCVYTTAWETITSI